MALVVEGSRLKQARDVRGLFLRRYVVGVRPTWVVHDLRCILRRYSSTGPVETGSRSKVAADPEAACIKMDPGDSPCRLKVAAEPAAADAATAPVEPVGSNVAPLPAAAGRAIPAMSAKVAVDPEDAGIETPAAMLNVAAEPLAAGVWNPAEGGKVAADPAAAFA
jgi:hypothetical protein